MMAVCQRYQKKYPEALETLRKLRLWFLTIAEPTKK